MAILAQTYKPTSADTFTSVFNMVKTDVANYLAYRKTVAELSKLTNRELGDLGLSRSGIKASALHAVYTN